MPGHFTVESRSQPHEPSKWNKEILNKGTYFFHKQHLRMELGRHILLSICHTSRHRSKPKSSERDCLQLACQTKRFLLDMCLLSTSYTKRRSRGPSHEQNHNVEDTYESNNRPKSIPRRKSNGIEGIRSSIHARYTQYHPLERKQDLQIQTGWWRTSKRDCTYRTRNDRGLRSTTVSSVAWLPIPITCRIPIVTVADTLRKINKRN